MSSDQTPPDAATPGEPTGTGAAEPNAGGSPSASISRGWLIGFGIAIVVLSFVAAFLGGWLARSGSAEAVATPEPTTTAESVDYEEALEEILPAGSAVRAGTGAPESGKGYEGDVYIDVSTADVYLFQDDWVLVGNIRESAAANLTGETGAQGETGATGEQGEQGEQGEPGTQMTLGLGAPEQDRCVTDGDLYIDTEALAFYECTSGEWVLFGPAETPAPTEPAATEPAATEEPDAE